MSTKATKLAGLAAAFCFSVLNLLAQPSFVTNRLVAYYPFSGNADDESGNENNGTLNGGTLTNNMAGVPNSAYSFNGISDFISIADFAGADADAHTISLWINANSWTNMRSSSGLYVDILGKDNLTPGTRQWVCQGDQTGQIRWAVFTSMGEFRMDSNARLQTNQWYQISTVWDGTNESQFINGVFDSSLSAPGTLVQSNAPVRIAGNPSDYQFFDGAISEVRIYDVALTPNQVEELYQYDLGPTISLARAVQPTFANLTVGSNYQLQVSADLKTWTNQGGIFIATNSGMAYPQFFYVTNWSQSFFRLQTR